MSCEENDKNPPRLGELEPLELKENQPDNEYEYERHEESEYHDVGSARDGLSALDLGSFDSTFLSGSAFPVSRAISSPMFCCSCLGK